jgi:hypothetical protein
VSSSTEVIGALSEAGVLITAMVTLVVIVWLISRKEKD